MAEIFGTYLDGSELPAYYGLHFAIQNGEHDFEELISMVWQMGDNRKRILQIAEDIKRTAVSTELECIMCGALLSEKDSLNKESLCPRCRDEAGYGR
jgi:hypothetical protein